MPRLLAKPQNSKPIINKLFYMHSNFVVECLGLFPKGNERRQEDLAESFLRNPRNDEFN